LKVFLDPIIALLFEFESELRAGSFYDSAFVEHVDEVGLDVVEQTLIVGDYDSCVAVGL
jgi:hypothetical protein